MLRIVPRRPAVKKHHSMLLQFVGALGAADMALLDFLTRRRRLSLLRGAEDGVMRGPEERPRRGALGGAGAAESFEGDLSRDFIVVGKRQAWE